MKQLIKTNVSDDPVLDELGKAFELTVFDQAKQFYSSVLSFDYSGTHHGINEEHIAYAIKNQAPFILLNTNAEEMSKSFGFGVTAKVVIVFCYEGYNFISPIGGELPSNSEDAGSARVTTKESGEVVSYPAELEELNVTAGIADRGLSLDELAPLIEAEVTPEHYSRVHGMIVATASPPTDLPRGQYKVNYYNLDRTISDLTDSQTAVNNSLMEVLLVASYNPEIKYLRISSKGAGFSPANGGGITWNDEYNRGYFQGNINVTMNPQSSRLSTYESSPKNVNGQQAYTSGSSFTVGVNVSKNPGFNPSYTISNSKTTTISDFYVENNSSGLRSSWDFKLGLIRNSIWDMFDSHTFSKDTVKGLPILAVKNLQAECESVWLANNASNFNERVPVLLNWAVDYYNCWVTGNAFSFHKHWYRKGRSFGYWEKNPLYVDFSTVTAD